MCTHRSRHQYDERGDVLYLSVDYDGTGAVIGMVLVNVRFLLERDGLLTLSLPSEQLAAAVLAPVLAAA